jgi:hypothetical protein
METCAEIAKQWHSIQFGHEPWSDETALRLAPGYFFVGPPMSFYDRSGYIEAMRQAGPAWSNGKGPLEIVSQFGCDEWFTSVISFHPATSTDRITAALTTRVVDGLVAEKYFAYGPRIAYAEAPDMRGRLSKMLGGIPGATYGLP